MAYSHRLEKIASVVRGVVSDAIANRLSDPRISTFASVTRVEVSRDLQSVNVYISVLGPPADERKTIAGLVHATGRVQKLLAGRLRMRHCPRLAFVLDQSIKKGDETIRMIDEAVRDLNDPGASSGPDAAEASDPIADASTDAQAEAAS